MGYRAVIGLLETKFKQLNHKLSQVSYAFLCYSSVFIALNNALTAFRSLFIRRCDFN